MALEKYSSFALISVIVFLVMLSAISIDTFFMKNRNFFEGQNDIFNKMFGQLRGSMAAMLYIKADKYFHGGTSHSDKHAGHSCLEGETEEHEGEEHGELDSLSKNSPDIFSRINKAISYRPVFHLNNIESAEIMPWFELAVLADPYYIKAYTVGGYWLGMRLGKRDKALQFLKRGLK
ncbi:MAG: hypothetical protein L6416_05560, partial [Candidatus Omnitrophica bacterium]|nr:hypothetical protein [Candidatus Omnitrophota bacterium]